MGQILPQYKKALYDDMIASIEANTAHYYAFASHPISYPEGTPNTAPSDYESSFLNNWTLLFGKKLKTTDIVPMIDNHVWTANSVYTKYDNTSNTISNSQFYAVVPPSSPGAAYNVYKCINNANNSKSTIPPSLVQPQSFTTSDGYTWRYMYSISYSDYVKFATTDYVPVFSNSLIVSGAYNYSGIETIQIVTRGSGYDSHHSGTIRSVVNSTVMQLDTTASTDVNFYTNNGIYIYNTSSSTGQLKTVAGHFSNLSGVYVTLNSPANTSVINPAVTQYIISPRVVFDTDGDVEPAAYSVVNNSSNAISSIVIIDPGYGISRANVSIVSNPVFSSNSANVYAIVPPPGGHGSNPAVELDMKAICISFSFNGTESNTIPGEILYNKIGIMKNAHILTANATKGTAYSSDTFSQVLIANVSGSAVFGVGDVVTGSNSDAYGIVAFSNSTQVYLTGDQDFSNGEIITSSNGAVSTTISINTLGDIYTKDINPLYVQNISDVQRTNTQSETFKLIISI